MTPNRYPEEIIAEHFDYSDLELFTDTIITKQKTGAEWDHIRAKLPEGFIEKLKKIMNECWQNGFCHPYFAEGKLKWMQIKSTREFKDGQQCDLCRRSITAGTCVGKATYFPHYGFKKCWEK